ncbi:MAG: lysophospholipid acyltransferase family protein, partial [Burkholderiales bacterium]
MSLYDDPRVVYWIRDPFWGAVDYLTHYGLRLSPTRAASEIGGRLGLAAGRYRFPNLTARCDQNLRLIRPDLSPAQRAEVIAKMWENVGRTIAEMSVLDRLWERAEITLVNEACILEQQRAKRPLVFAFPHLGHWETLAIAVQRMGITLNVVFENLRNRFQRKLTHRARRRLGYRLLTPDRAGIRETYAALERGEAV